MVLGVNLKHGVCGRIVVLSVLSCFAPLLCLLRGYNIRSHFDGLT